MKKKTFSHDSVYTIYIFIYFYCSVLTFILSPFPELPFLIKVSVVD